MFDLSNAESFCFTFGKNGEIWPKLCSIKNNSDSKLMQLHAQQNKAKYVTNITKYVTKSIKYVTNSVQWYLFTTLVVMTNHNDFNDQSK